MMTNATKLPMSEKAVDRITKLWFIFGERDDGTVDVSSVDGDIFCGLPKEVAIKVIEAHDKFREELYSILCK